ncbi:threonine-phosphate decarboxylase [Pleionea litopenaei]|uniref:Aminotransferase n=1 Tax=Pleionea litopenaei TaxID=3070815 RepID=A0AA51RR44_9GAMM|nr:pyridoxal phosphate-dependent class II aminotransferase [Pleionea sp. HL-JVS1]WMS86071.1 pyridoxal phosphate-dependent class II aminotransferase [Pleionea sp. HL-JVS1]
MSLRHGGQLETIQQEYHEFDREWIDLSTGISPVAYPIPKIPSRYFRRLPDNEKQLIKAARAYYKVTNILPVAGSQSAIKALPIVLRKRLNSSTLVFLPTEGYKEHEAAWSNNGYSIKHYDDIDDIKIDGPCVVVIINPNNPTGKKYSSSQLQKVASKTEEQGGWCIIDEAFIDAEFHSDSMVSQANNSTIVLRSLGKFFGLAGLRVGFVVAESRFLDNLNQYLGPWCISGVSEYIAICALLDSSWQDDHRYRLMALSQQLVDLLKMHFRCEPKGTSLFQTIRLQNAPVMWDQLCKLGVYVRLCDNNQALRFGTPNQQDFETLSQRLDQAKLEGYISCS